jgi:hypothetical protein
VTPVEHVPIPDTDREITVFDSRSAAQRLS